MRSRTHEPSIKRPHRACLGGSRAFALRRSCFQVAPVVQKPESTEASSVVLVDIAGLRTSPARKRKRGECASNPSLARRAIFCEIRMNERHRIARRVAVEQSDG